MLPLQWHQDCILNTCLPFPVFHLNRLKLRRVYFWAFLSHSSLRRNKSELAPILGTPRMFSELLEVHYIFQNKHWVISVYHTVVEAFWLKRRILSSEHYASRLPRSILPVFLLKRGTLNFVWRRWNWHFEVGNDISNVKSSQQPPEKNIVPITPPPLMSTNLKITQYQKVYPHDLSLFCKWKSVNSRKMSQFFFHERRAFDKNVKQYILFW